MMATHGVVSTACCKSSYVAIGNIVVCHRYGHKTVTVNALILQKADSSSCLIEEVMNGSSVVVSVNNNSCIK